MMEFDYIKSNTKFYPVIPLILKNGDKERKCLALIDSGGELSIFQKKIAHELGINYLATKKIQMFTGVCGKMLIYVHEVRMIIGEKEFNCPVGFSDDYGASFNLLGRQGFFENFKITFNETNHKILLE